jgi:hypothetical protein
MEGPANTVSYFVAGYVVIFVSLAIYLASLIIRWRNLKQDEAMLMQLEEKETDEG